MKDQELLNVYVGLVPFLAAVCGPGAEIVVHDVMNTENSIIAIGNGISGRKIGDPLTDLARDFQQSGVYKDNEFMHKYKGHTKKGDFLSSTFFIKNKGKLIGMLCINKSMVPTQELNVALQTLMEQFNLASAPADSASENLNGPIANMMNNRITEIISQSGILPSRMSIDEKVKTVHRLNDAGVLMMKGAVAEIAKQLSVSIPTVYRYLNKSIDED